MRDPIEEGSEGSLWKVLTNDSPLPIIMLLIAISLFIYIVEKRLSQFYNQEVVIDLTKQNTFVEDDPIEQTNIPIPKSYKPFVEKQNWDSILRLAINDTTISTQQRNSLIILALYNKKDFDSIVKFVDTKKLNPTLLPTEICLYYAFSIYSIDQTKAINLIENCLKNTQKQNLYLKAASFLIKHFESEATRKLLLQSDSFITAKYRPYWHYYMGLTYALEGSRDSAIWHLEQAINYKPNWIKPRMKLVELLPNTEQGLQQKEKILLEIIKLRPTYAPAHYMLAVVRQRQGKANLGISTDSLILTEDFSPEVLIHKIRNEISSGNYRLARKYIEDLLSLNPNNPHGLFLLGNWYRAVDSLIKAKDAYWEALKKARWRFPEAWLNLGITYRRLEHIDSAIMAYNKALEYRKDYYEALFNLGVAYWHADSIHKAHQIFKRLSKLMPDHDRTWYFLGRTYERLQKPDSAIMAYRKALNINPSYRKALLKLAELDDSDQSIALLEEYLSQNPSDIKILKKLGDKYVKRKKYIKSIQLYEQVLRYDPDNTSVLRSLASIYQRLGNAEKALKYWQEVLDRKPNGRVTRRRIAELYLALGDTTKAIKHFEKLIRIEPERVETWNRLIALYQQKGWVVRPTNRLSAAWQDDLPDAGRLAYEIATFARKAEKYLTARRFYKIAREKGYRKHWAAFWIGRIYLNEGDTAKAIKYFKLAVEDKDDFGLAWKRLAQLYIDLDSLNQAQQALEKAKQLRPDDPDIAKLEQILKSKLP